VDGRHIKFDIYEYELEITEVLVRNWRDSLMSTSESGLAQSRRGKVLCALVFLFGIAFGIQPSIFAQDVLEEGQVRVVKWNHRGDKLAVAYDNGHIQIVEATTRGSAPLSLQTDGGTVLSLAWSPDDRYLASGSASPDHTLSLWNTQTAERAFDYSGFGISILKVAWSPDGNHVIAVTAEGLTSEGNAVIVNPWTQEVTLHSFGVVSDIQWSPDNTKVVFATIGGISVRDATNLQPIFSSSIGENRLRSNLQHQLITVAWSPDGNYLAGGLGDGQIYVWTLNNTQPIATFVGHDYQGGDRFLGWIHALDFDESSRYLTSASGDGTLRTWDLQTKTLVGEERIDANYAADFSRYGGQLAIGLAPHSIGGMPSQAADPAYIVTVLADGEVQVIIPQVSLERIHAIAQGCISSAAQRNITFANDESQLPDFIAQLDALTDEQIPPGCRADLLAIVEAIEAE
jgi:WD40 repeat protein